VVTNRQFFIEILPAGAHNAALLLANVTGASRAWGNWESKDSPRRKPGGGG